MKKLLVFVFLCVLGLGFLKAQTIPVAGWGIIAMGSDRNHLSKINGDAYATLVIQNEKIVFSIWDTESNQPVGPSILLHNLYVDQAVAEGNSFIGMQSAVSVIGSSSKSGTLYLSQSKRDGGDDILHFDFGSEQLYILGSLIDEAMCAQLAKLASIGVGIKVGGKLKIPLSQLMK